MSKGTLTVSFHRGGLTTAETIELVGPIAVRKAESTGLQDMARLNPVTVGHCIYCGTTDSLRREHIIAFGLHGNPALKKASCRRCEDVTKKIEGAVLRGPMRLVRVHRRLQSRTKHAGAPRTVVVSGVKDGLDVELSIPIDEAPILLPLPIFGPPKIVTGDLTPGMDQAGVITISFGQKPHEVAQRFGLQALTIKSAADYPYSFARMIAKIAHCYAYATRLITCPEESKVVPAILGSDDIGRWVGMLDSSITAYPGVLHRLEAHRSNGLVFVNVQLFADSETPTYAAVLQTD